MRALPVGKIWGAGAKTQEEFKKQGLKTCDDIYCLSVEQLTMIFGNSFGLFLYRAVRGEAAAAFDEERGSHSMSAERTFPYDLFDEFAVETALFDICQSLIWRLLDQELQSRTVFIKIRYGDFTTESAQETSPNPVTSINDLFDRILALFHKKYKTGRGIRLIGAGLSNLETGSPQGELFEGAGEKESKLEKKILEINKKYPNAALRKGRSWLD
jgi:DNA polymerase-4